MKTNVWNRLDNVRKLSGTLRPSGRFSVCQTFPRKSKDLNHEKIPQQNHTPLLTVSELDAAYQRLLNPDADRMRAVSTPPPGNSRNLGLSNATNSRTRSQRGSRGIRPRQRDLLCWSANQLERVYTKPCMSFLTLTLPALSDDDLKSVQCNWSKIVNEIQNEIKRKLRQRGIDTSIVGCSELQLEREVSTGHRYPHLHLVFRGRLSSRSHWVMQPCEFRQIWRVAVGRFLDQHSYEWSSSENVQQVRRSSGGYLAKYISKCGSKGSSVLCNLWHPSDWILCSRRLRGLYTGLSYTGYDIGITLLAVVENWNAESGYKRPIMIKTELYGERKIGEYGWLRHETKFLTAMEWFAV